MREKGQTEVAKTLETPVFSRGIEILTEKLELQQKQFENQLGSDMMNTLISEAMKMPEVKKQISQGMNITGNKKR